MDSVSSVSSFSMKALGMEIQVGDQLLVRKRCGVLEISLPKKSTNLMLQIDLCPPPQIMLNG